MKKTEIGDGMKFNYLQKAGSKTRHFFLEQYIMLHYLDNSDINNKSLHSLTDPETSSSLFYLKTQFLT